MTTTACPGCGLPRATELVGATACPVCGDTGGPVAEAEEAEPKNDYPVADAPGSPGVARGSFPGEPGASATGFQTHPHRSSGLRTAGVFLLGLAVGVAGVLGWQEWRHRPDTRVELVADAGSKNTDITPPKGIAVAPPPREVVVVLSPGSAGTSDPLPTTPPPVPGDPVVVELDDPAATYTPPFPLTRGEHLILRGTVAVLQVPRLDGGATLDASALHADTITVAGPIDHGSVLKVCSPGGTVTFADRVDGKSVVEITAPGGVVRFTEPTTAQKPGAKIDGGSRVTAIARRFEFRGEITGTGTRVGLTLTRGGELHLAAVKGQAVVEYRALAAGWSAPTVLAGAVAPTAVLRKVE